MHRDLFESIIRSAEPETNLLSQPYDEFSEAGTALFHENSGMERIFEAVLREAMQDQSVDELKTSLKSTLKDPEKHKHLFGSGQMPTEKDIDDYHYDELKPQNTDKGTFQSFSKSVTDSAGNQCGTFGYRKFTPADNSSPSFDQIKFWSTTPGNNRRIAEDAALKIIGFLRDEHAKSVSWEMIEGNEAEFGYRALCRLFGVEPKKSGTNLLFEITAEDYENNKTAIENLQPQQLMLKIAQISRGLKKPENKKRIILSARNNNECCFLQTP